MEENEVIPWIENIVRRMKTGNYFDFDDLVGAGCLGYADALSKHDPSMPNKFKTYAEFRVKGAIVDFIRDNTPLKRNITGQPRPVLMSLDSILDATEPDGKHDPLKGMVDLKLSYSPDYINSLHNPLLAYIDRLDERKKYIMKEHFYNERTLKEIGVDLGLTESRISQIVTREVAKMRIRIFRTVVKPIRREQMRGITFTEEQINERKVFIEASSSLDEIAAHFKVSKAALYNWKNKYPALKEALDAFSTRKSRIKEKAPEKLPTKAEKQEPKPVSTITPLFGFSGIVYFFKKPIKVNFSLEDLTEH